MSAANIPKSTQQKKVRILVTGGGGFVGSHLAKELLGQGHFVRVVDINWSGYMEGPYASERLTLDLRDPENARRAAKDIDWVFHLAADMGGIGYITQVGADIMRNSSLLNLSMLTAAVENDVERFFFSSSACVYPEYRQLDATAAQRRTCPSGSA